MSVSAATLVAASIAAVALALRLGAAGVPGLGADSLPLLFVAALLCAAGLLRRRFTPGAWLVAVTAGGVAAIEVIGSVRAQEGTANAEAWPRLVGIAELSLFAAVVIASAYAIRGAPGPPSWAARAWRGLVVAAMAVIGGVGLWVFAVAVAVGVPVVAGSGDPTGLSGLRVSGRLAAGFVAVAVLVGMWRDLAEPLRRAWSNAQGVADMPRALGEQLLPSASAFHRRGREEERARLAADLHALVLPDLRRAARTAEASGHAAQPLAADLRHAVEGIERLMHERQSVVFEEFGLVAALEGLAERTQEQAPIDVVVELDRAVDDPDALPKDVTRAAFRVAILAVDNVVRHAGAARLELGLDTRGGALVLSIIDDGRGTVPASGPARGRGLADMRTAATEVGASVDIRPSPTGTSVAFRWTGRGGAAGDHAASAADSRDIPPAPNR